MKFLKVFAALIFLTPTLHAQIPFFGGRPFWQAYYPGTTFAPPYYPQAYYPQPYSTASYYQWPYAYDPFVVTNYNEGIDSLTRQVQQLNDEIRMLEAELASARAQEVQQALQPQAMTRAVETPAPSSGPPVILVFKNGQRIKSQGYAVMGETLWVLTRSGSQRVALCSLDIAATQSANRAQGFQFPDLGS